MKLQSAVWLIQAREDACLIAVASGAGVVSYEVFVTFLCMLYMVTHVISQCCLYTRVHLVTGSRAHWPGADGASIAHGLWLSERTNGDTDNITAIASSTSL